jgi:hypothetical protein
MQLHPKLSSGTNVIKSGRKVLALIENLNFPPKIGAWIRGHGLIGIL